MVGEDAVYAAHDLTKQVAGRSTVDDHPSPSRDLAISICCSSFNATACRVKKPPSKNARKRIARSAMPERAEETACGSPQLDE